MEECIKRFYIIVRKGFEHKSLTKARGIGWLARVVRSSIYHTSNFEEALSLAFNPGAFKELYGLQRHSRVAVTTTAGSDLKLIANYNRGGTGYYLDSRIEVFKSLVSLFLHRTLLTIRSQCAVYFCSTHVFRAYHPFRI